MEIAKARIQNYKSIVDSEEVDINPTLTVLIGKNEQGKSNFLSGLRSFNADYKYIPSELPNHLRPMLDVKPPGEIPIVTLWLKLSSDDLEQLKEIIKDIEEVKYLRAVKFYDNNYKFTIVDSDNNEKDSRFAPTRVAKEVDKFKIVVNELKTKLTAHAKRLPEFGKNQEKFEQLINTFLKANFDDTEQIDNLVKTFYTGIRGVPGQDKLVQDDIVNTTKSFEAVLSDIKKVLSEDREKYLNKLIPKFVLHISTLDKIPNEVAIAQFISAPEKISMSMLNLCRAAGLSIQKIQELALSSDTSERQAYEDYHKGHISGPLNNFWTQEKYEVHFRIDKEKLSVAVSDATYSPRIPPSERSDGFQWLLSFYSTIQNECASPSTVVILLDNPALELHVDGQRDIKKFLEDKITLNNQVIYVTHSPALVDPCKLSQIRIVELMSNKKGTKISNEIVKRGEHIDILEPLRSAIGSSVGYSLLASNYNILVEGMADKFLLEGVLHKFCPEIRNSFIVNGSLAESKDCLLARMYKGLRLPFVAVLDADSKGREIASKLRSYEIENKNIIEIKEVFSEKGDEFAVADLVSPEMYYEAVKRAYPDKPIEQPEEIGPKIENTYESKFRDKYEIGFCKTRVTKSLKKMLIEDEGVNEFDVGNLEKLAKEINKKLTDIG